MLWHYNKVDIFFEIIHVDNKFRTVIEKLKNKWDIEINFHYQLSMCLELKCQIIF